MARTSAPPLLRTRTTRSPRQASRTARRSCRSRSASASGRCSSPSRRRALRGYAPLDSGGCPDEAIAAGVRYAADNGAKVINLSLGGPGASTTVRDALTYAVGKGAFIAVAAGNEFEEGNPLEYPAGFAPKIDGVMAVARGRPLAQALLFLEHRIARRNRSARRRRQRWRVERPDLASDHPAV